MAAKDHRKKKSGRKAEKRKTAEKKKKGVADEKTKAQNPKAFGFQSRGATKAQRSRSAEKEQRRLHAPILEADVAEPPPFVVLVHGPPQVGKSTLIRCLVKHYTRHNLAEVKGPITVVGGKKRRLTFVECPNDLNAMIDASKYADLVLLLIDGGFGFEMETFEFLNLLQVAGFPKVMGVLTHLDGFTDQKRLKKTKKKLKSRFWTEIYDGAKLFYLSGIQHGKYLKREIFNLARFISCMKLRPLTWRTQHPYLIADRFEDITPRETIRQNPKCDRDITVYGYLRGCNIKPETSVHIAGVGDHSMEELDALPDPCPLPDSVKKRALNEKERLLYAPLADVGGLLYDRDAVYIDIPDWKVQFSKQDGSAKRVDGGAAADEGEQMVRELQAAGEGLDEKLRAAQIRLFPGSRPIKGTAVADGFSDDGSDGDEDGDEQDSDDDADEDADEDEEGDEDDDDDGDDEDDDSEEEEANGQQQGARRRMPQEEAVMVNGRLRRKALFDDAQVEQPSDAEPDSDEERLHSSRHAGPSGRHVDALGGQQQMNGRRGQRAAVRQDSDDDHGDETDDSEGLGGAAHWKDSMLQRAAALFSTRAADLQAYVYGKRAVTDKAAGAGKGGAGKHDAGTAGGGSDDSDEEFFRIKGSGPGRKERTEEADADDALDTSRPAMTSALLEQWGDAAAVQALRNRFVTGDWAEGAKRSAAQPGEEDVSGQSDDEAYGEFEDMETGEKFEGGDAVTAAAQKAIEDAAGEELRLKKIAKKAAFDSQYDGGNSDADEDAEKAAPQVKGAHKPKEETYYEAVKREMLERQVRTRTALDQLDAATRTSMEGLRPGTYVRIRFTGVPCELVEHFDPFFPLLLGGVGQGEDKLGYMRLRLKRHRWSPKILKTNDPLVFSIGWRRWQSIPVYALEDHNRRLRMLKYTPEHMHCIATIWGPLAPPNTGVVAVQNLSNELRRWRISATGVVTELDASQRIVKKLKLVGSPFKIGRHTAFVGGMFNSQLEAAKFEGASIRTVSGIRGTIKKALRAGVQGGKDGSFRATFEDKPLLSDVVFLRAWVAVDLPKLYNPVTNLLGKHTLPQRAPKKNRGAAPAEPPAAAEKTPAAPAVAAAEASAPAAAAAEDGPEFIPGSRFSGRRPGYVFKLGPQGVGYYQDNGPSMLQPTTTAAVPQTSTAAGAAGGAADGTAAAAGWVGMRTVAELRRALGVGAPRATDSLYRPIERAPRKFNPLKVPKALQAALPFQTKPKLEMKRKHKSLEQKRAVVLEKHEKKAYTLVQQLNAIRNEKARKRHEVASKKHAERAKKKAAEEEWRGKLQKEQRKKRYRDAGQAEKKREFKKQRASKDD